MLPPFPIPNLQNQKASLNFETFLLEWMQASARFYGPGELTAQKLRDIADDINHIHEHGPSILFWIDIMLEALDGCWRSGYTPEQIVEGMRSVLVVKQMEGSRKHATRSKEQ